MEIFKQNKNAIYFLMIFIGSYLLFNTLYGLFIESFGTRPDPITISISKQVAAILRLWGNSVNAVVIDKSNNVSLRNEYRSVISVYEGCNGLNVFIVFVSFLFAFKGELKLTVAFTLFGAICIHAMNLLRVALLYFVEIYWPRYLYLFHKYLFTGIIYAVVFALWYLWVKRTRRDAFA